MQINFSIKNWAAFAPGLENQEDWRLWALNKKDISKDFTALPNIDFIPPMQRRRLSQLTKMALKTAFDCNQNQSNVESVFASRFGEWNQSVKILESIAKKEEISPAAFSLSVHNSAAGIYSIINHNKLPYSSISANEMTFQAALIEALAKLQNQENILLVIGEEMIPPFYQDIFKVNFYPFALALMLSKNDPKIKLNFLETRENKSNFAELDFLKWYLKNERKKLDLGWFDLELVS